MQKNEKHRTAKKAATIFLTLFVFYQCADDAYRTFKKREGLFFKCSQKIFQAAQNARLDRALKKIPLPLSAPKWTQKNFLISHAMGGIEGEPYTNCLEAFEKNYQNGIRVFEVDLSLSSDGTLCAAHDWNHFESITGFAGVPSKQEFLFQKICGKFTPLTIDDVVSLMKKHEDVFIVTDKIFPGFEKEMVFEILRAANNDASILERFIIQVYSDKNFSAIEKLHHFKNYIYTLYVRGKDNLEQNAKFCAANNIPVVTMWADWTSKKTFALYKKYGIRVFAHTVNDAKEGKKILRGGGYGLYTDFLTPSDFSEE